MSRHAQLTDPHPTPLAVAQAELEAARDEVKNVEAANAETEERFGAAVLARDAVIEARGTSSAEARKLAAEITALTPEIEQGRARLDAAKRRAARMAEAVASENRAIAAAKENVARQRQRVERAEEMLQAAVKLVKEREEAVARELKMVEHFRSELDELTGGAEPSGEES